MRFFLCLLTAALGTGCAAAEPASPDDDPVETAEPRDPADPADPDDPEAPEDPAEPPATPGSWADPMVPPGSIAHGPAHAYMDIVPLDDGRVLYCVGQMGLALSDATDPESPSHDQTATTTMSKKAKCFDIAPGPGDVVFYSHRGDSKTPTAYVSAWDTGTRQEVGLFTKDGTSFEGIDTVGDQLWVAAHLDGLIVLEHSDTGFEERATLADLGNAWGLVESDGLAFVTDAGGAINLLDSTDPLAPAVLGHLALEGTPQALAVTGRTAWIAAASAGVIAVDATDPAAPLVLSQTDTPGSATHVAAQGDLLAVADWNDVRIFDVTDPTAPELVTTEVVQTGSDVASRVLSVGLRGDVVFAGEWDALYTFRVDPEVRAPDVRVDRLELDLGTLEEGESGTAAVVVQNEGREPLVIGELAASDPWVTADVASLTLEPGESAVVEISLEAATTAAISQTLTLVSDDPDEGALTLDLVANQPGVGVGDLAPAVAVSLLDGGSWSLSDDYGQVVLLAYFATF